jgi:hypothetical protein
MANIQPTYALEMARGFPGMVANGETSNRISRTVEDAAGLAFGRAAFRGTGSHGCTGTPATGAFMGVVISDLAIQPLAGVVSGGAAADIVPQYGTAGLMNEGVIWVTASGAVTQGAAAYVTSAGAWTATTTSNTAVPAVFDNAAADGALVRLRVRRS